MLNMLIIKVEDMYAEANEMGQSRIAIILFLKGSVIISVITLKYSHMQLSVLYLSGNSNFFHC